MRLHVNDDRWCLSDGDSLGSRGGSDISPGMAEKNMRHPRGIDSGRSLNAWMRLLGRYSQDGQGDPQFNSADWNIRGVLVVVRALTSRWQSQGRGGEARSNDGRRRYHRLTSRPPWASFFEVPDHFRRSWPFLTPNDVSSGPRAKMPKYGSLERLRSDGSQYKEHPKEPFSWILLCQMVMALEF